MRITCEVDGRRVEADVATTSTAIELLRDCLGHTSAKLGCAVGRCGACVVLLDGRPVNACLVPAYRCSGARILTRDGLDPKDADPVTDALRQEGAIQCGACAPGLIVTLAWLRREHSDLAVDDVERSLVGHLCRCSGYVGLRRALRHLFPYRNAADLSPDS